ncbi:hypothetical protein S7711_01498 [Stachybotrys chartarum IBT 7711]|uniref:mRNA export factor GLE1 n=1 Tax=Stachybotrys chartarum (strain CBS 109288 / IBT 7711) TaxID=1280523 RepID=A0A084B756_STACB|nr:hypothetical protein S7711_01498 [Stachybotrys chartarum IBT 7711]
MTQSSPSRTNQRQSQPLTSPDRRPLSSFLSDDRNNELSHRDALEAAQKEHDRVRENAIRVYQLYELQEQHQRILDEERKEQERLEAEARIIAEEKKLRELKAKTVPRPPEPKPEKPPTPEPQPQPQRVQEVPKPPVPIKEEPRVDAPAAAVRPPMQSSHPPVAEVPANIKSKPKASIQQQPTAAPTSTTPAPTAQTAASRQPPLVERYSQIHQELKKLRRNLQELAKSAGQPFKGKLSDLRREVRISTGQLAAGKGANTQPMNRIVAALKAALDGQVPSPPIDVSRFVVGQRQPEEGAVYNDATLPSLFIYLINICAKGIINQYINECGANPKAADPIGVVTAQIFSNKDFQWRGQTLIDILLAKFHKACPVLFGIRGNAKTERGRLALGWRKDGPSWESEKSHNDRMTGLGAGFAAMSLRDFSKTTKRNPYPPTNYWKALANIVNTPENEITNTQMVVLRSMIEGYEQRFITFYGNAAVAALRVALVEFPEKAVGKTTTAVAVQSLAKVLQSEAGLVLT